MNILEHGIEIKKQTISGSVIDDIKSEVSASDDGYPRYGIRNAEKKFGSINQLASSDTFISLASSILGSSPQVVRVIFFDKTPDNNWLVSWHQDKTITVDQATHLDDWGPWSIKDGIHHVQPPLEVLEQMVTFRLHLDDADENNGCLKVIPGSHKLGILAQDDIAGVVNSNHHCLCKVKAGDLVIMRPHILHASTKSTHPVHRRVVHIEYSNYPLPGKLQWA